MVPGDMLWLDFSRSDLFLAFQDTAPFADTVSEGWALILAVETKVPTGRRRYHEPSVARTMVTFLYHGRLCEESLNWVSFITKERYGRDTPSERIRAGDGPQGQTG